MLLPEVRHGQRPLCLAHQPEDVVLALAAVPRLEVDRLRGGDLARVEAQDEEDTASIMRIYCQILAERGESE